MEIYFFVVVSIVTAVVFFLAISLPFFRIEKEPPAGGRFDHLGAIREQIERDRISGLVGEFVAAEAIVEAKRASTATDSTRDANGIARKLRFSAVAFLALTPVAAGLLYFEIGSPRLNAAETSPGRPALDADAIANLPENDRRAIIEGMVAGLSARLEQAPNDVEGWRMLARSQFILGDPNGSATSYRQLLALDAGTLDDWRNFSLALIAAVPERRFPIDQEFVAALDEIEKREPGDPMVLFYRGGVAREVGNPLQAIELWTRLLEIMPTDAPVRRALENLIEEAQDEANAASVSK